MQMDNISNTKMFEFTYNEDSSYSANFNEWCYLNRKERETFGDTLLSTTQAKSLFDAQYGAKNPGNQGQG
jgi:hypothetical protein